VSSSESSCHFKLVAPLTKPFACGLAERYQMQYQSGPNASCEIAEEAMLGFQIQTSCSAVRSPPASPVLSTPRGSIRSNLTSLSA
jgi:hypothetical protein